MRIDYEEKEINKIDDKNAGRLRNVLGCQGD